MTETSKKRRKCTLDSHNQTVVNRGLINANWQKFLVSSHIMEKNTEKPVINKNSENYSGLHRRARKKRAKEAKNQNNVINGLETLNIDTETPKPPKENSQNHSENKNKLTKFIAMDCEMVGVGYDGGDNMLARVSLVNKFGDCIYDKFVKAREEVTDYRTSVSGVRREDLLNGEDFVLVQKEVAEIIKGRILVGHSLKHDLSVLFLSHPKRNIRDTSRYKPFRKITKGSTPSLKRLAKEILGIEIQHGEHSSVEDARAAMQIYCSVAKKWESMMSEKRGYNRKKVDE